MVEPASEQCQREPTRMSSLLVRRQVEGGGEFYAEKASRCKQRQRKTHSHPRAPWAVSTRPQRESHEILGGEAQSPKAVACRGWYKPISPPPGSRIVVFVPHAASATSVHFAPFASSSFICAGRSSHMRYSTAPSSTWPPCACVDAPSAGCTASSEAGNLKMSHPSPTSTDRNPRTSRKKARSASGF